MSDNIVNLGNVRSDLSNSSKDWTPVELLRNLLARCESGEIDPEIMWVAYATKGEPGRAKWSHASPDGQRTLGVIEQARMHMHLSVWNLL